jgi:hypothetical protein
MDSNLPSAIKRSLRPNFLVSTRWKGAAHRSASLWISHGQLYGLVRDQWHDTVDDNNQIRTLPIYMRCLIATATHTVHLCEHHQGHYGVGFNQAMQARPMEWRRLDDKHLVLPRANAAAPRRSGPTIWKLRAVLPWSPHCHDFLNTVCRQFPVRRSGLYGKGDKQANYYAYPARRPSISACFSPRHIHLPGSASSSKGRSQGGDRSAAERRAMAVVPVKERIIWS